MVARVQTKSNAVFLLMEPERATPIEAAVDGIRRTTATSTNVCHARRLTGFSYCAKFCVVITEEAP